MNSPATLYKRHRFPSEIIHAVWLYHRFNLSPREIEDLLAEKGTVVTLESIRLCCIKFGPKYARKLRRQHQATQARERGMRRFKLMEQAQRFLCVHAAVCNLFNLGRHLVSARYYRDLRQGDFTS